MYFCPNSHWTHYIAWIVHYIIAHSAYKRAKALLAFLGLQAGLCCLIAEFCAMGSESAVEAFLNLCKIWDTTSPGLPRQHIHPYLLCLSDVQLAGRFGGTWVTLDSE